MRNVRTFARWTLGLHLVAAALKGYLEVSFGLMLLQQSVFTTPSAVAVGAAISTFSLVAGCLLCAASRFALPVACLALLPQVVGFAGGAVSYAMTLGVDWSYEFMLWCQPIFCLPDGYDYRPPAWRTEFQLRTDQDFLGVGLIINLAALLQLACVHHLSRPGPDSRSTA